MFVLAHQGCCCDLGNHQPRVQPRFRRQKRWQIETQSRVHHQRHAALRNRTDLCHSHGYLIRGKTHRLCMEIAARYDAPFAHQNQRVVRHRIGLNFQHVTSAPQQINRGTAHLRLTADAIGVLHAGIILAVALADLRALHQAPLRPCGGDLAAVAAQRVNFIHQRRS